jgi:hypothetical protein
LFAWLGPGCVEVDYEEGGGGECAREVVEFGSEEAMTVGCMVGLL